MTDRRDSQPPACRPEDNQSRSLTWLRAIADITELMVISDVREPEVLRAFETLRELTGAERVCVQVTPQADPLDETRMIVRAIPFAPPMRVLPLSDRWRARLAGGSPVLCDTVSAQADERQTLADLDIRSIAIAPMIVNGLLRGCFRIENCGDVSAWGDEDVIALRAISVVLGNALGYREAQEDLKESDDRFRRLLDNAPDAIYRMSLPDGAYEYMSPAATEITGYTPEQYTSTPLLIDRLMHPGWRGYFAEQWSRLLQGDVPPEYAYAIIHGATGETRWINQRNVLLRNAQGTPTAIEGIITDVTRQQLAETRLRSREATLRAILSNAPIAIGFNSDRTLLIANDALCRITGYASEELVGRVTDFLYPTQAEFQRVGLELVAQLEQGTIGSIETQWVRKDGTVFDVLMVANCVTPDDYAIGVTFAVLDMAVLRSRHG